MSLPDIFDISIAKCRPNSKVTFTAFFGGVDDDDTLTKITNPTALAQYARAIQVAPYDNGEFTSFSITATQSYCENRAPILEEFIEKGDDDLDYWVGNKDKGWYSLTIKFVFSVEPDRYPGGKVTNEVNIKLTCYSCLRVKPVLLPAPPLKRLIAPGQEPPPKEPEIFQIEQTQTEAKTIEFINYASAVWELKEDDYVCELAWHMRLIDTRGAYHSSEVLAGAIAIEPKGTATGAAPQLTIGYDAHKVIDSKFLHSEGCNQYLSLDWQVYSALTLDMNKYSVHTSD